MSGSLFLCIVLFLMMWFIGFVMCTAWANVLIQANAAQGMQRILAVLAFIPIVNIVGCVLLILFGFIGVSITTGLETISAVFKNKDDSAN